MRAHGPTIGPRDPDHEKYIGGHRTSPVDASPSSAGACSKRFSAAPYNVTARHAFRVWGRCRSHFDRGGGAATQRPAQRTRMPGFRRPLSRARHAPYKLWGRCRRGAHRTHFALLEFPRLLLPSSFLPCSAFFSDINDVSAYESPCCCAGSFTIGLVATIVSTVSLNTAGTKS